jgi:hypothetical protein
MIIRPSRTCITGHYILLIALLNQFSYLSIPDICFLSENRYMYVHKDIHQFGVEVWYICILYFIGLNIYCCSYENFISYTNPLCKVIITANIQKLFWLTSF